jgi:hypothetical protein
MILTTLFLVVARPLLQKYNFMPDDRILANIARIAGLTFALLLVSTISAVGQPGIDHSLPNLVIQLQPDEQNPLRKLIRESHTLRLETCSSRDDFHLPLLSLLDSMKPALINVNSLLTKKHIL